MKPPESFPATAPKVVAFLVQQLGFQTALGLLVAAERDGIKWARIPSARALRLQVLRRLPQRIDRALVAAELGVSTAHVGRWWRRRHGRTR